MGDHTIHRISEVSMKPGKVISEHAMKAGKVKRVRGQELQTKIKDNSSPSTFWTPAWTKILGCSILLLGGVWLVFCINLQVCQRENAKLRQENFSQGQNEREMQRKMHELLQNQLGSLEKTLVDVQEKKEMIENEEALRIQNKKLADDLEGKSILLNEAYQEIKNLRSMLLNEPGLSKIKHYPELTVEVADQDTSEKSTLDTSKTSTILNLPSDSRSPCHSSELKRRQEFAHFSTLLVYPLPSSPAQTVVRVLCTFRNRAGCYHGGIFCSPFPIRRENFDLGPLLCSLPDD